MIDKNIQIPIARYLEKDILSHFQPNKVVVIYGPRRVGKTTLLHQLSGKIKEPTLWLNGENLDTAEWLSSRSLEKLKNGIGSFKAVIIDEAQCVDQIGLNLKILVDSITGIRIIATGSSSFDLANQVGEPLVGRKWQYTLYPIAQLELSPAETPLESKLKLESRLIYGSYPEAITAQGNRDKQTVLESIVDGALFKDVFMLEGVKKPSKIVQLAKALALQIGSQVSLTELSNLLNINLATVERYLDLLEKTFIILRVSGFRRNLRTELTKTCRYYFWDNGIRNTLINNFNPLEVRSDAGQLWENYIFIERMKKRDYQHISSNIYFWRTHDRQEIDLVEERAGKLYGIEIKWSPKKVRPPRSWLTTYPNADFTTINRENYLKFITS
ncbi:MAG: AAA ATPase [Microgenomates group bacterium Gr01-1014_7]|nr:MAG: AAA ATPase [Microgenomates group bacterium Gr01-1014_7]